MTQSPADDALFALNPVNSDESRTEKLQNLLKLAQSSPFLLKDPLRKIQQSLQILLQDPLIEISLLSTNIYTTLISSFPEMESDFLGQIIRNLGDSQPVLRKASHTCLLSYLRITTNFDPVLKNLIEFGLENSEWQIRQKSINSFQSLFLSEARNLKWESNFLRKLVESLIDRMLDSNNVVAKASEQALLSLNSNENFRTYVFKGINKNKQEILINFIENYKGKVLTATNKTIISTPVKEISISSNSPKSFLNIAANLLEKTPENSQKKSIKLEENMEKSNNARDFLMKSPNSQKIYGIFPLKIVNELLEDKDWQTRSNAIEEIEKITDEIEAKGFDFLPHLTDFLKLLTRLLQDNNFKICLTTVNILSKLLVFREMRNKQNVDFLYPKLLEKLGDSKIAIRQACVKIIKEIVEKNLNNSWLETLLNGLENNNQHIREESLNLLCFFIGKVQMEDGYYEKLLIIVVKFLEDLKLKVKVAALDTIKAIGQRMEIAKFKEILKGSLTEEGFDMVMDKVIGEKAINNAIIMNNDPENLPSLSVPNNNITTNNNNINNIATLEKTLEKEKRPNVSPGFELSTSCSSRSIPYSSSITSKLEKKDEEKRALSAFSLKTSAVSEELERINEKHSDSSENQIQNQEKPFEEETTKKKLPISNLKNAKLKFPASSTLKKSSISLKERGEPRDSEHQKPEVFMVKGKQAENLLSNKGKQIDTLMIKGKEFQKKPSFEDPKKMGGSFEDLEEEKEVARKTKNPFEKSSNFDYKQACYLEKEDLEPLKNPESSFKNLLMDIKTEDWAKQFESLNTLRRLTLFHPEILTSNTSSLHFLMLELLRLIESLRSSVSKNAMLTTTELLEKLKKYLDSEADMLFSRLMKKGLDASAFIIDEVKRGLIAISSNCSENKIIPLLLSMTQTKASQAKLNLLICYEAVIRKNSSRFTMLKDHDKLLQSLVNFMFDGNNEVRNQAKAIFLQLNAEVLEKNELEKVLLRVLNDQAYQKVQILLEKEGKTQEIAPKKPFNVNYNKLKKSTTPENVRINKEEPQIEINNFISEKNAINMQNTNKTMQNTNKVLRNMSNKLKNTAFDQESLSKSLILANNSDWKDRIEGIKGLNELIEKSPEEFFTGKNATIFLDNFLKLLNDSNAKVSLFALQSFKSLIGPFRNSIENNLANVINAVFQALGSFNAGLRNAGLELLDEIIENQEKAALVQGFCNGSLYAVAKARSFVLGRLIDMIEEVYENKPNIIMKHVCPLVLKLIEENKADLKPTLMKLLETLRNCLGDEFLASFPTAKSQIICDFLRK